MLKQVCCGTCAFATRNEQRPQQVSDMSRHVLLRQCRAEARGGPPWAKVDAARSSNGDAANRDLGHCVLEFSPVAGRLRCDPRISFSTSRRAILSSSPGCRSGACANPHRSLRWPEAGPATQASAPAVARPARRSSCCRRQSVAQASLSPRHRRRGSPTPAAEPPATVPVKPTPLKRRGAGPGDAKDPGHSSFRSKHRPEFDAHGLRR